MLRKKIVGTFVAIWFAVCLSYGGIRAALAAVLGESQAAIGEVSNAEAGSTTDGLGTADNEGTAVPTSEGEQASPVIVVEQEDSAVSATDRQHSDSHASGGFAHGSSGLSFTPHGRDSSTATAPSADSDAPTDDTVSNHDGNADVTSNDDGFDDDSLAEENGGADTTEGAGQEAGTADIPSLSEYLSQYTCGSCRRNCSLDNPRCFNGSRLADAKAQEYYDLY